jgi:hypothetical protein
MRKVAIQLFLMLLTVAAAWPQCQVIDDFTTGKVRTSLRTPNTSSTDIQMGSMLGGVRETIFLIGANQFLQPAEMDIDKGGPLVVSTGVRESFRLDVQYGVDKNGAFDPLGYYPTGCDRFRVTFDSASLVLNFNILVFQGPLNPYFQDGLNLDPIPFAGNPFCVDFLFSNFKNPLMVTQDFAGQGINGIDFIFQTGSVIGANDFAITKFETTTGDAGCVMAPPL